MRSRYFRILFCVLTLVAFGASVGHTIVVRRDRIAEVDNRLREFAGEIIESRNAGMFDLRARSIEQIDRILDEELGQLAEKKFFAVYNNKGEKLFERSPSKILLPSDIPRDPQWLTFHFRGNYIRILNLKLPSIPDRDLQVGLIIPEKRVSPSFWEPSNLIFLGSMVFLGLAFAWLLASQLMQPIGALAKHFSEVAAEPVVRLPAIPEKIRLQLNPKHQHDELVQMVNAFSQLLSKLDHQQRMQRSWSYQVAHELKTPLAILEGEISRAAQAGSIPDKLAGTIRREVMEASETVTSFLSWAELESPRERSLYAVSVRKVADEIATRLSIGFPGRLNLDLRHEFYIFAGMQHFEHTLLNLVQNALVYSTGPVSLLAPAEGVLVVRDQGPGVSAEVISCLGEPFNRGTGKRSGGHGLGLAFVHSVCRLYNWKLEIEASKTGTAVTLRFPEFAQVQQKDSFSEKAALRNVETGSPNC